MRSEQTPIMRTSAERTGKMMAIMLGICVVGGAIFFAMWDYWISEVPPAALLNQTPEPETGTFTGEIVPVTLRFIEASNFIDFSFNEVLGEPGANPDIVVELGDKIEFNIISEGISFHAFGVTADETGFGGIFPGSEVGTATSPMTRGDTGTSEFIPPEEGIYYYICTVAGHREQGMVGRIIVGDVDLDGEVPPAE